MHLAIYVSIQRHSRAWNRNAFRFPTRKFKVFGQVVMESTVEIEIVRVVPLY